MAKIEIKDGKIFSENDYRTDVFEIVEKIPENYVVWNIGENMGTDKYIPICQLKTKYDVDLFRSYADNALSHDCGTSARCS